MFFLLPPHERERVAEGRAGRGEREMNEVTRGGGGGKRAWEGGGQRHREREGWRAREREREKF